MSQHFDFFFENYEHNICFKKKKAVQDVPHRTFYMGTFLLLFQHDETNDETNKQKKAGQTHMLIITRIHMNTTTPLQNKRAKNNCTHLHHTTTVHFLTTQKYVNEQLFMLRVVGL